MAVPYHTHSFEIPAATKEDVIAGVATDKAVTPSSLGSSAVQNVEDFATAEQGRKADTAVQPDNLAKVATTGEYSDLKSLPAIGTAAGHSETDFATAHQGQLAESAVQPGDLADVATSGKYSDLKGTPQLGTASGHNAGDFATAAQGAKADSALQPADVKSAAHRDASDFATAGQGAKADSAIQPADIKSAARHDAADFASAAQGAKADTAVQPGILKALAYKDKVGVSDIDATGTASGTTFLAGDGSWKEQAASSNIVFAGYRSGNVGGLGPGVNICASVSFKATSKNCTVNCSIVFDELPSLKGGYLQIKISPSLDNGSTGYLGGVEVPETSSGVPYQVTSLNIGKGLVVGTNYTLTAELYSSANFASVSYYSHIVGACI